MSESFFEESREQSVVKAEIVAKYFWAWAKVILPTVKAYGNRLAYADLFAGPGRYDSGTKSTPLLVLEKVLQDADLKQRLVTIFNDMDPKNTESLTQAINALPGIETLKHKPQISTAEIGEDFIKSVETMKLVPTFSFVDPFGYKGLSLRLVNAVLKDWGCDCVFFFNYNRINMGLNNDSVRKHMEALFGQNIDEIRARLEKLLPEKRELLVVEELTKALEKLGGKFVLPFRFRTATGTRTSHHLIFVTKHFRGYEIMKDIMANASTSRNEGVASFEYNPTDQEFPVLFELQRPLSDLADMLLQQCSGKRVFLRKLYEEHSVKRQYVLKNYQDTIRTLEAEGRVQCFPPADQRRKRLGVVTMPPEKVEIQFP